jgi:cytosine deaminase
VDACCCATSTLPDGRTGSTCWCAASASPRSAGASPRPAGAETLDRAGSCCPTPFVDAHFHMDATLSHGLPRVNRSGTLLEGIALWGELKPHADAGGAGRACAAVLRLGGREGLLAIRTMSTSATSGCSRSRRCCRSSAVQPYLDLQLVAFPQDGVLRSPTRWRT